LVAWAVFDPKHQISKYLIRTKVKSSQVYTPQHLKSTRQKSNAHALLAQVKCLSSSGPKSSWAEETTTPLRGVHGLFTKLMTAPWALKCLKVRSLAKGS
jgi:hypothetical protein